MTNPNLLLHLAYAIIGAVVPGGLRTAPIHMGCAVELVRRAAEDAEVAQEVEAGVEEAKAWVHGDVAADAPEEGS